MDARLTEFAEVLRQNGLRLSTAELSDAARAISLVGLSDLELFKASLRATLCKRAIDKDTFDRCFQFFFTGAAKTFEALDKSLFDQLRESGLLEGDGLEMVIAQMQQLLPGLSPLAQAALNGDVAGLAQIFRGASLQLDLSRLESGFQTGFFSRRLLSAAGIDRAATELRSMEEELRRRGVEGVEVVSRQVAAALRAVEDAARKEIARQVQARVRRSAFNTQERSLQQLSANELSQAQTAVRKLAERLKARLIRRQKSRRKGNLNVRRTLRKNMPWGGVPMLPKFRSRRPDRPEVVVLCDVSDSVRNTSRVMLLFAYTLQSLFSKVRSFVFVSDVGEVTRHFKDIEPEDAVDVAVAGREISLASNSNYGRALALFARDHLPSITRRSTVMVIGDGRNNFNPANAWALDEVRRKAKRVLWIATEDRPAWGFGDSEMHTYAQHVDQVVVVQSLADLGRVAEKLVTV